MLKEKLPFVLINTLLLYIRLLALTDRQYDGQSNEYTHCAWAGGTKSQFVVEGKFIHDSYNTCLKLNIRIKIL